MATWSGIAVAVVLLIIVLTLISGLVPRRVPPRHESREARSEALQLLADELGNRSILSLITQSILVYYNPAKPEEAVLQPGVPRGLLPLTAAGAVMFFVGLGLILIFTGAMEFPPGPWVTGLVFLVSGLALILFALWNIWTVVASWQWPTTEAEVTYSEVVQGSERLGFQPRVAYRYEVQGVSYTATAIDWGRFDMPRAEAQRVVDKYPVGELVTVHHHPTKPHRGD